MSLVFVVICSANLAGNGSAERFDSGLLLLRRMIQPHWSATGKAGFSRSCFRRFDAVLSGVVPGWRYKILPDNPGKSG